jgi:hypothetical protein
MTLAETADRRVTGHGADGREAMGDQRGSGSDPRSCARGFTAGMASADDNDVK